MKKVRKLRQVKEARHFIKRGDRGEKMIQFSEGKEMRKLGKGVNVKKREKVLSKLVGRKLREVREH